MEIQLNKKIYNVKSITALVDTLLAKYDTPKVYSRDPSVAIETIAKNCGIEAIIPVPGEEIKNLHAIFEDSKLRINEADPKGKQVFSIAHEIGHIILGHIDITARYKVARHGISGKTELLKKINIENCINLGILEKYIQEELADFFAANLLVPINRFLLWEDRSDDEIAAAFGVEKKCIIKRRAEIQNDLSELVADTVSAG
jgi:Zn-dependent peptidase ImmA (M78 family)